MDTWQIAAVQMDCRLGETEQNLRQMLSEAIDSCAGQARSEPDRRSATGVLWQDRGTPCRQRRRRQQVTISERRTPIDVIFDLASPGRSADLRNVAVVATDVVDELETADRTSAETNTNHAQKATHDGISSLFPHVPEIGAVGVNQASIRVKAV